MTYQRSHRLPAVALNAPRMVLQLSSHRQFLFMTDYDRLRRNKMPGNHTLPICIAGSAEHPSAHLTQSQVREKITCLATIGLPL